MSDQPVLPYGRQSIDDADRRAVEECLKDPWITQGPRIERFEKDLCAATGAAYAVAVSSGTAALHLAVLAAGAVPGDAGVVPAITFVASANAIAYAGGSVRFTDVDPDTALMDLESLDREVRRGAPPKILIPVDMTGQPADLPAIRKIANQVGARVIEDAAHSLGASYDAEGRSYRAGCCAHTDLAILSFHPVKHITTGEGGAVLTNDRALAQRLQDLRSHGITRDPARMETKDEGPWYHEQQDLGYNYRITDLQCALGISQIGKLESFVRRRREIAAHYDRAFAQEPLAGRMRPLRQVPGRKSSYHLYVIRVAERSGRRTADLRRDLYDFLGRQSIRPQVHYIPVPRQPYYRRLSGSPAVPGADAYYESCLSLPMFPSMSDGDVERVIAALKEWARVA